jgi:hypothetical protein
MGPAACDAGGVLHRAHVSALPPLVILALGDWPAERLHSTWEPSSLALPEALRRAVDDAWDRALARPGVNLFDGPLCRLERFGVDHLGLHLQLSPTSYRLFMGTNGLNPQWADQHGPQVMANAVGTSVVLRSADGHLVFGRRSQAVALYPGHAHPFGGTIEPAADGSPPDLLGEMRRELQEEVGIADADLDDLRIIALLEDGRLRQPELVYIATCRLGADAIVARLDPQEHTACWLIADHQDAIDGILRGGGAITPVLAGALLTWGWRRFGDAWLESHLAGSPVRRQPVAR